MKRPFASLFKRAGVDGPWPMRPDQPAAGQIYAFRTVPYSPFAPPQTHRYAAFKIIGLSPKLIAIAVLDGIWPAVPVLSEARASSIIAEHRFAYTGRPATFGVNLDGWTPDDSLQSLVFVGVGALSSAEQSFADTILCMAGGAIFAGLTNVNYVAEGEWRWSNDREAFVAEQELKKTKDEALRAAKQERYRTRLSKLTWEQLLSEAPFEHWSRSPPYPSDEFTTAARCVIRDACLSLRDLGAKPRKAEVRAILKKTVQWFNDADGEAGNVIETDEREDICAVLEEIAHVARQTSLVDEIEKWRDW